MGKQKKSSNARASAFGWMFQSSAGWYLFLDNIRETISIKMEGQNEDIEITLEDNSIIYAQAKSVEKPTDTGNNLSKLKDALRTLSNCKKSVSKLIYITNILNPLNSKFATLYNQTTSFEYFACEKDKQLIKKNVESDFPLEKFQIVRFNFFGDNLNERYKDIHQKTREFLVEAGLPSDKAVKIFSEWKDLFVENNSQKCSLKKTQMVFPLILVIIENNNLEDKYNRVCSLGMYDDIYGNYNDILHKMQRSSEFFIKVCGDYQKEFIQGGDHIEEYVRSNWEKYSEDFSDIVKDGQLLESFIKLLLLSILLRRRDINNIKRATNLK